MVRLGTSEFQDSRYKHGILWVGQSTTVCNFKLWFSKIILKLIPFNVPVGVEK